MVDPCDDHGPNTRLVAGPELTEARPRARHRAFRGEGTDSAQVAKPARGA